MKRAFIIFACCSLLSAAAQPLVPGMILPVESPRSVGTATTRMSVAAVAPPYASLFSIRVLPYTPQISMVEFYCATNSPRFWSLEKCSDLKSWRKVEEKTTTNDVKYVPKFEADKRLVTWLLVKPQTSREFYRLKVWP